MNLLTTTFKLDSILEEKVKLQHLGEKYFTKNKKIFKLKR